MATTDSRVRSGTLTFTPGAGAAKDYSGQFTSVAIVPNVNEEDPVEVLDGGKVGGGSSTSDTLDFTMISDHASATGLVAFSWKYRGATIEWSFIPDADPLNEWTGECVMKALQVGGEVGSQLSVEGSLSITVVDPPTAYGDGALHPGVPV